MDARPTLEGTRVLLRPLHASDLDAYFPLLEDTEGLRFTGTQRTFTRDDAARWLASLANRDDRIDLAIILRDTNTLIGEVVINDIDTTNRSANIRIGLLSAYTNAGYGSEAMRLMIQHAFTQVKLHRLELEVYVFNPRAMHVYQRLGFQLEGRRRDALYLDGMYHDAIGMSMLDDEYRTWEMTQRNR